MGQDIGIQLYLNAAILQIIDVSLPKFIILVSYDVWSG